MEEENNGDTEEDCLGEDEFVPLTEEEKEAMRAGRFSSGVETDEADIDGIIYQLEFEES